MFFALCIDEECRKRWRTLRERYTRELRRLKYQMKNDNCEEDPLTPVGAASWSLFNEMNFLQEHVKLRKTRMSFEKSIVRAPLIKTDEMENENEDDVNGVGEEEELITDDQQHEQQQQHSNEDSNPGPQVYAKYTIAKVEGGNGITVLEGYKEYEPNVIMGSDGVQETYERKCDHKIAIKNKYN